MLKPPPDLTASRGSKKFPIKDPTRTPQQKPSIPLARNRTPPDYDEQVIDYRDHGRYEELLTHEKNRAQARTAQEKYLRRQDDPQEEGEAGKGLGAKPRRCEAGELRAQRGTQEK